VGEIDPFKNKNDEIWMNYNPESWSKYDQKLLYDSWVKISKTGLPTTSAYRRRQQKDKDRDLEMILTGNKFARQEKSFGFILMDKYMNSIESKGTCLSK
jgi:hypothetical protein